MMLSIPQALAALGRTKSARPAAPRLPAVRLTVAPNRVVMARLLPAGGWLLEARTRGLGSPWRREWLILTDDEWRKLRRLRA